MEWKPECDLLLLQEIIVSVPYQYKVSTREGGKIWEDITERLNANEAFAHRLGQKRAVRDRYTQPRSQGLSSSHKREWSKKDPGSGWSRALVTKLSSWEGYQFFRKLSPLAFVTSKTRLEQSPCFLGVFIVRFRVAATGMLI